MKKSLLVLLTFALVFGMVTPAFAATEPTVQEQFDALKAAGILTGDTEGNILPDTKEMDRQTLAKIACLIKGVDPTPGVEIPAFANDYKKGVWGFVDGWIQAAYSAKLMEGNTAADGSKTFDAKQKVTKGHLMAVILRAMGQTGLVESGKWYKVYMDKAAELNLVSADADGSAQATYSDIVKQTYTAKKAELVVEPTELAVESVKALNALEIEITFNKAVDAKELVKSGNYTVTDAKDNNKIASSPIFTAAEDNKSVVITLDSGTPLTNFSDDNIVTVAKEIGLVEKYENEAVAVQDSTFPVLEKVESTGPNELTLSFNEPVVQPVDISAFTLDKGTVSLDASSLKTSGRTLVLETYGDLKEGTHSLVLKANSNVKDGANLTAKPATFSFDHSKDATAPTVSVKSSDEFSVTLKFSKNVSNIKKKQVLYSHTYSGSNQLAGDVSGVVTEVTASEYKIKFTNAFPPGSTNFYINYATDTKDADKIKDNYGNVLAPVQLSVSTVVDVTKPEITKVEFASTTTIEVGVSESVTTTKGNYTLTSVEDTDTEIAIDKIDFDDAKKLVTITLEKPLNGGNYLLTVEDIKDTSIAKNEMVKVVKEFTASDKVLPTIVDVTKGDGKITAQKIADKKVKIKFSEAMNADDLENKLYYQFDGAALDSKVKLVATDANKAVILDFTDVSGGLPNGKDFTVGRLADVADNKIAKFATAVDYGTTVSIPVFDKAEVADEKTVKLYFKEALSNLVAADFAVDPGTGFVAVESIAVNVDGDKTVVSLITKNKLNAQTVADGSVKVQTVADSSSDSTTHAAATSAQNEYGSKVKVVAEVAADKMAPSIVENGIETMDVNKDGKIDHIKVTFDEKISAGTVSADKFTVAGYDVIDAYVSSTTPDNVSSRSNVTIVNDKAVYVTVEQGDDPDTAATPKVSVASGIKDVALNSFEAVTDEVAKDKALPVIVSFQIATNTKAITEITFSEPVYSSNDKTGALIKANLKFNPNGTPENLETIVHTAGSATATATTTTAATSTDETSKLNVVTNSVYDAAGNAGLDSVVVTDSKD